jgi:hypothetical protein
VASTVPVAAKHQTEEEWRAFLREPPHAATKSGLPLIIGATFGTRRSGGGSYRTQANVKHVTAAIGDMDSGGMTLADARQRCEDRGIAAYFYTTPSHTPDKPRWRVVAFLSRPHAPGATALQVAKLNEVLAGVLTSESYTESQAFYIGTAGQEYEWLESAGSPIDLVPITARWKKPNGASARGGEAMPSCSEPELVDAIRKHVTYHDPLRDLVARWMAAHGEEETRSRVAALKAEAEPTVPMHRAGRFKEAFEGAEFERSINGARKFAREEAAEAFAVADPLPEEPKVVSAVARLPSAVALRFSEPINPDEIWNGLSKTKSGAIVNNVANAALLLVLRLRGESASLHFDEFSRKVLLRCGGTETEVEDRHVLDWTVCLQLHPTCQQIGKDSVHDAVSQIARYNSVDVVREYLDGLEWDGTPRAAVLLSRGFGAEASAYTKAAGTNFLVGAVARQFRPGAKVDNVIVLEGPQGIHKSTGLRALFTERWFSDSLPSFGAEDFQMHLQGKVCFEAAELHAIHRGDIERTKNLLTMQSDRFRPKYGRHTTEIPRRCVFAGTTNQDRYLHDQTGNRRVIPVECGAIDLAWIADNREQLWAEAVALYRLDYEWWRYPEEATAEQEMRRVVNGLEDAVMRWRGKYPDVTHVCALDILEGYMNLPADRAARLVNQMADALKACGFVRNGKGATSFNGKKLNWFRRNDYREGDPFRTAIDAQMNVEPIPKGE